MTKKQRVDPVSADMDAEPCKVQLGRPDGETHSFGTIEVEAPDDAGHLEISFQRTIRVSDNANVSNLPPDLGDFPLYSVADYTDKLPADVSAKGGFFFPMYQREAMWIDFHSDEPFAIKIYVGGVNAVSGEPVNETPATLLRRLKLVAEQASVQDYVVTPKQRWLGKIIDAPL
jgi:hypothetical protein